MNIKKSKNKKHIIESIRVENNTQYFGFLSEEQVLQQQCMMKTTRDTTIKTSRMNIITASAANDFINFLDCD